MLLRCSQRQLRAITGKYCDTGDDCREREQRCHHCRPTQTRPASPQGLEFQRQLRIAELIVIEVYDRDVHAVFHFACAKIM